MNIDNNWIEKWTTSVLPEDIVRYKSPVFRDDRGLLHCVFEDVGGLACRLDTLKMSLSKKNVARGLHWQRPPHPQMKVISVIDGSIVDILVNMDRTSSAFRTAHRIVLKASDPQALIIPAHYAHGFLALEDTRFLYACSGPYRPDAELSFNIREFLPPFDEELIISEKDRLAPCLSDQVHKL